MRLRLTVQRNALPAANILWNVPETNSNAAYTITRLLEDVNHIMPLEAENWGLEDYAVEVGGFECLHFTPVTQALKEDDHVCIRPLMTAEVRARTLTGRLQISDGGQHLVDGVPFGRPYLRTPHRPAVRIPPRKRERADQQEADEVREARDFMNTLLEGTSDGPAQQQIEDAPRTRELTQSGPARSLPPHKRQRLHSSEEASAREARDALNTVLAALGDKPNQQANGHGRQSSSSQTLPSPAVWKKRNKVQRRQMQQMEEDQAMADFLTGFLRPPNGTAAVGTGASAPQNMALVPHGTGPIPSSYTNGPSRKSSRQVHFKQPIAEQLGGSDEDDDDDDDFAPGLFRNGIWASDDGSSDPVSDSASEDSSSGSDSSGSDPDSDSDSSSGSDSDSDSDSNSDSDASSPPDLLSSKDGSKVKSNTTKPASPTVVPPGGGRAATKSRNIRRTRTNRLRRLKELGLLDENATLADLQAFEDAKRGKIEEEPAPVHLFSAASGKRKRIDDGIDATQDTEDEGSSELEKRKQELMARLGCPSSEPAKADEAALSASLVVEAPKSPTQEKLDKGQLTTKEAPTRRLRPDTSAISRILARQAARPAKKAKTKPVDEGPPEPEGASDPDYWKSRINLSAFECWEEEYELTAPPFPFKQHWDPASKLMRDKKHKGKKKGTRPEPVADSRQSEDEEEKIILNYDEAPAEENLDVEINAAIEDQLRQDVATAAQEADLPPLPEDVSTLPVLTSADIKEGAIIVCKFFAVNPITITPEISGYKTAVVEKEGDSGNGAGTIQLKIAARDLPQREKKFDKHGNRIYDAGAAFLMEDEEEEEGLWEGQFGELLEAKLLQAAVA
ncbi:hypothetical protein T440DRAFT_515569 [Plenodomus tracheiphilus IPT5]|uniref:DUF7357 domain-containing protein n=1 Tax=Plenodomus tracheiphilus IPT5 TaxID=1408161 RepID=A0A6A7BFG6_9PLEO|nr:hypothetical protein T440DRAFT_515569 [Plenodomus tracheiphilus IPT5]